MAVRMIWDILKSPQASARFREFRVIESQILGWVALGADEIVRVKGRFELQGFEL